MHKWLLFCVSGCIALGLIFVSAKAEDKGTVDGAIWEYEMSKVTRKDKDEPRIGKFRIEGSDIFQPRNKKPTKIGTIKRTGKGKPQQGDKVHVDFEQLLGNDQKKLKCKGPITFISFGEVEGRLIDSDGMHWNFKASRIKE